MVKTKSEVKDFFEKRLLDIQRKINFNQKQY